MFQEAEGEIKKISSEEIIECYDHNEALMERLEGAHEEFLDRIARVQTSRQSYLVNYVVDALMGEDERGDVLALTDEEKDFIFLVLKTVIDLLDQKVHSHEVVLELLSGSRLHISSPLYSYRRTFQTQTVHIEPRAQKWAKIILDMEVK